MGHCLLWLAQQVQKIAAEFKVTMEDAAVIAPSVRRIMVIVTADGITATTMFMAVNLAVTKAAAVWIKKTGYY